MGPGVSQEPGLPQVFPPGAISCQAATSLPHSLWGSLHCAKADRLKGALSLPGLLASLSPQVASAQADAGFVLT